jgi:hypothetical protein
MCVLVSVMMRVVVNIVMCVFVHVVMCVVMCVGRSANSLYFCHRPVRARFLPGPVC